LYYKKSKELQLAHPAFPQVSQGHQTYVPLHSPYVKYSFLLVRNSNFIFKMHRFPIFDFKMS